VRGGGREKERKRNSEHTGDGWQASVNEQKRGRENESERERAIEWMRGKIEWMRGKIESKRVEG